MKPKVYLDATIPSYLHDDREVLHPFVEITRQWWADESGAYQLFVSNAVIDEVESGNYPRKADVLSTVRQLDVLPFEQAIVDIAEFYIEHRLMPQSLRGDAAHLAYASYYRCDFLLTIDIGPNQDKMLIQELNDLGLGEGLRLHLFAELSPIRIEVQKNLLVL